MNYDITVRLTGIDRGDDGLLSVTVEISSDGHSEKKKFVLPEESLAKLGLGRRELTVEEYDALENAANRYSAYRRGSGILAYGANSEKALIRKLTQKGFDRETARDAASKLRDEGYIDENSDALREAERCVAKLWGPSRIISHLYEKGYCNDAVNYAKNYLEDIDFVNNCRELIRKKYSATDFRDRTSRDKTVAALIRYGYSVSTVSSALSKK